MIKLVYTNFNQSVGYDCSNDEKPFYIIRDIIAIVYLPKSKRIYLRIPHGFKSDGCTILLKIVQLFIGCSHTPQYLPASLLHDFVLQKPWLINYDRKLSSEILYAALLKEGVNPLLAYVMYKATDMYQAFKNIRIKKWK